MLQLMVTSGTKVQSLSKICFTDSLLNCYNLNPYYIYTEFLLKLRHDSMLVADQSVCSHIDSSCSHTSSTVTQ